MKHDPADNAEPLIPGQPFASYPERDPLAFKTSMKRDKYIREYGFCVFTQEVLEALASILEGKKVLEAGSGSGWLSLALGQLGVEIIAADWRDYGQPPERSGHGYAMQRSFRLDHHGDAVELLPGNFDAILLVWPNWRSEFGERVLQAMRPGQIFVYEGEQEGGNCGTDAFFALLRQQFQTDIGATERLNENHWRFPSMNDFWLVATKT